MEGRSTTPEKKTDGTPATPPIPQFTQEQIKEAALKQAEDLGIGPQAMRKTVLEVIQGQQLLSEVGQVIDDMTADGLPSATVEDILNHMQQNGFKTPEKAYKDMYEKEYIAKQVEKLSTIKKQSSMPSISNSTAGGKMPPANTNFRRMDDETLRKMINESITDNAQQ